MFFNTQIWVCAAPARTCVDEFVRMVCEQGGIVACEALQRERAREPGAIAQQERACRQARANPIFLGRTQMALTLADRLLGHGRSLIPDDSTKGAPAFKADEEIEFDLSPDSFNASEINDPQVEEFFEAILEDPELQPRSARLGPTTTQMSPSSSSSSSLPPPQPRSQQQQLMPMTQRLTRVSQFRDRAAAAALQPQRQEIPSSVESPDEQIGAVLGDAAQAPPNDEGPPPEDGLPPDDGDSSSSLSVDMDQFDGSLGESVVRKI